MASRAYIVQTVAQSGPLPRQAIRPAAFDLIPSLWQRPHRLVDGRSSPISSGVGHEYFCVFDVTPAEHALLIADARVTYLPIEDALGNVLAFSQPVSAISLANRTAIRTLLAARHIPDDGIQLTDPINATLSRIARRFILRDILRADDLSEGLDTLISAIPALRRQAIRTKLITHGIDFDGVLLTDTIRQAIVKIVAQNTVKVFQGG